MRFELRMFRLVNKLDQTVAWKKNNWEQSKPCHNFLRWWETSLSRFNVFIKDISDMILTETPDRHNQHSQHSVLLCGFNATLKAIQRYAYPSRRTRGFCSEYVKDISRQCNLIRVGFLTCIVRRVLFQKCTSDVSGGGLEAVVDGG